MPTSSQNHSSDHGLGHGSGHFSSHGSGNCLSHGSDLGLVMGLVMGRDGSRHGSALLIVGGRAFVEKNYKVGRYARHVGSGVLLYLAAVLEYLFVEVIQKNLGVTTLDQRANNFDLMYEQVKALKDGIVVEKPIYNHVSGLLDPSELIKPPKILVIEGLHPMYDQRVRALLDFSIYLDISNDVKFAWKIQRDLAERGHNLKSIKASIEARKPDFDAYIERKV
ncbi:hypothetical protein R6Q59_026833 [Mikania micrantha]